MCVIFLNRAMVQHLGDVWESLHNVSSFVLFRVCNVEYKKKCSKNQRHKIKENNQLKQVYKYSNKIYEKYKKQTNTLKHYINNM